MTELWLRRLAPHPDCTFGRFEDAEHVEWCKTLELPWRNNEHSVSCIPAGAYVCRRAIHHPDSPHAYEVFEVTGVPDRSAIHIHIANKPSDLRGCIAPGVSYGTLDGEPAVLHSTEAFKGFMLRLKGVESFTLHVVDP